MKDIKVLGSGCARCATVVQMIKTEAERQGIRITLEKITDYGAIASFGIASTPGIVIDGKAVHAGGIPKPEDLAKWLKG